MTQSMDPSILAQLAGPSTRSQHSANLMSRSLGAEQMSRSLGLDPMSQSMGEEEFKHSLGLTESEPSDPSATTLEGHGHLTNGETEVWGESVLQVAPHGHPRPTSLFRAEADLQVEDLDMQGTEKAANVWVPCQLRGETK